VAENLHVETDNQCMSEMSMDSLITSLQPMTSSTNTVPEAMYMRPAPSYPAFRVTSGAWLPYDFPVEIPLGRSQGRKGEDRSADSPALVTVWKGLLVRSLV
jgi:hypothetical protein